MRDATDRLIESLVESAGPVRRLRPPAVRATLWLLAVAALGALTILLFSDLSVFARRASDPKLDWELAGTLLTGIVAVVAAFEFSLPDRSPLWALLPLPPLALWIASSGYSCYRHWLSFGPDGWEIGESAQCFRFILAVGVPLGVSLLVLLRKVAAACAGPRRRGRRVGRRRARRLSPAVLSPLRRHVHGPVGASGRGRPCHRRINAGRTDLRPVTLLQA